jgi:hypothetical protein
MNGYYEPIDFLGFVGYPHEISKDVIDNLPDYHNYGDASAHIRSFTQCIDEWCDPPIYEDVLMQLFIMTFCKEYAYNWFHDSKDNTFKTTWDLLHAFFDRFGDDQDEIHNELVDDFMDKWKRKNILAVKTTISDIEVDTLPDPIEELKKKILNMQYAHTKQCENMQYAHTKHLEAIQLAHTRHYEAMNEQFMAMGKKWKSWKLTLQRLLLNIRTPLNLSLTTKKMRKFIGKFQMVRWIS